MVILTSMATRISANSTTPRPREPLAKSGHILTAELSLLQEKSRFIPVASWESSTTHADSSPMPGSCWEL